MAEHDVVGSKIAGLESERLRLQTELLEYRHENLEIRSPLSGVVVSGDLHFIITSAYVWIVSIEIPDDLFICARSYIRAYISG